MTRISVIRPYTFEDTERVKDSSERFCVRHGISFDATLDKEEEPAQCQRLKSQLKTNCAVVKVLSLKSFGRPAIAA